MGADIKSLRVRMKSVDSTLHLTKAMGLVASSKIHRANLNMKKSKAYAAAIAEIIDTLTLSPEAMHSPYMQENKSGKTKLIVIAGDRGLAGGYNANIFRFMRDYPQAEVIAIGKRAATRYGQEIVSSEHFSAEDAAALSKSLCESFKNGEFDRLGIVSTTYVSMMTQTAGVQWVLPLTKAENAEPQSMLFEPNEMEILNSAVPLYVSGLLMSAIRESFASEVAARRVAMDSAGKNAQQMLDDLQLNYNMARQGAITQEITEIVAGSGE